MKISEKQLLLLMKVLEGTLQISGLDGRFGLTREDRINLYTEIVNQQDEELREISKD
jgi:hypothetical protein